MTIDRNNLIILTSILLTLLVSNNLFHSNNIELIALATGSCFISGILVVYLMLVAANNLISIIKWLFKKTKKGKTENE